MTDIESEVRSLISGSGKSLKKIAQDSGIDYYRLWRWYSGGSSVLRANDAEAIKSQLTEATEA